jgi:sec-independent protein translocase protein TatC
MKMKTKTKNPRTTQASLQPEKLPLIEHLKELRRRLFYIVACVAVGSIVAYAFERRLIDILLRPSHGQNFIYTSPLGGMNFLFSTCLDIGLVVATPVIIYQVLAFLHPLMKETTRRFLLLSSAVAGAVALAGVLFGYFIGLPSALHFLLHQFTTLQVRPLITIQSYMSFVAVYLLGSALMFQLPLILIIINRIKPLTPGGLFKYERHVVIFAFVTAFIMNPTPNIIDQLLVVVPMIVMYQLGIGLIWLLNRSKRPGRLELLLEQDTKRRTERTSKQLRPLVAHVVTTAPRPAATPRHSYLSSHPHLIQ